MNEGGAGWGYGGEVGLEESNVVALGLRYLSGS